jgi:LmbE family N-acetylglucosaminyl deacetylase
MSTIVCLHAHPDDEASGTGGTIARAAAEGHRVVLVLGTNGDHGEVPDDLAPGETLVDRRRKELQAAAEVLGVARIVWLGYSDSGMTGWEQNADSESFHQADLDEAAGRLADVLREESADVLTTYDWHGGYGHPDHVKVHQVGIRAGEMVPGVRVLESTMNRTRFVEMMADAVEKGVFGIGENGEGYDLSDFDPEGPADDGNPFGTAQSEITLEVDVRDYVELKRAALACHSSQVTDSAFFLQMPIEAFRQAFGSEWFIEHDRTPPMRVGWLFDNVAGAPDT